MIRTELNIDADAYAKDSVEFSSYDDTAASLMTHNCRDIDYATHGI